MSVSRHIPIAVCGVAVLLAVLMAPVPLDDPNGGKGIGRVRLAKLPRLGEPARFGLPQANEPLGQESQPEPLPQQQEAVQPSAVASIPSPAAPAEPAAALAGTVELSVVEPSAVAVGAPAAATASAEPAAQSPVPIATAAADTPAALPASAPQRSALAAIGDLVGGAQLATPPGKTGPKLALAEPYAAQETTPSVGRDRVIGPGPATPAAPQGSAALPEAAGVMAGDWNPAFPPLPAWIAPPDAAAAKLAIAAYRKGDMVLGDVYAAGVGSEAARVALEWAAIRTDPHGTGFPRIIAFLKAHPDWPSASWLRRRAEEGLYADKQGFSLLSTYFAKASPESPQGKLALVRLYRKQGRIDDATSLLREVWRKGELSSPMESKVIAEFGDLLTPDDHKFRADRAFYKEDTGHLLRMAALAGPDEVALAKAQAAVIEGAGNAEALLAALPLKLKSDPSFILARIQLLRRANTPAKLTEAAQLMLNAPRDPAVLVDGDAWWVERRLVGRKLLDAGDPENAYLISAQHGAMSPESRIEAEFHAGWIALRFLDDPTLAAPHFALAAATAVMPASVARAAYWQGRTAEALGDEAAATSAYEQAATQVTTYYGQLARGKLNLTDLPLRETSAVASGDDRNLAVRVAEYLYALGESDFALPIVTDAARHLADVSQMAALGKVVEISRDARAALVLGKLATQRGFALDNFAFPTFGVPYYRPVANSADKTIVYSIVRQESAFAPTATSTAGAQGLMQLMPDTARRTAQHAGIALDMSKLNSDASLNARIGAAHLGELFAEQGGSYILTFAAYNAGGKRVKEWITAHGDPRHHDVDPVDWIELIPIAETRDYVQRIIENLQVYRIRFGEATRLIDEAELRKRSGG